MRGRAILALALNAKVEVFEVAVRQREKIA
jgi:hypothetical protein